MPNGLWLASSVWDGPCRDGLAVDSVSFLKYTSETVSWHELITTHGRWLRNVHVSFAHGEFKVFWIRLDPGEEAAVLIDRLENLAYISKPFKECQLLAAQHGYELVQQRKPESFVERIEKFLVGLRRTAEPEEASDRAGHDERGGVAHAVECPGPAGGPCVQVNPALRPGAGTEAALQGAQGAGDK